MSGKEWVVDAFGCTPARLADGETLRDLMQSVVRELALKVVGTPQWHQFGGPGGHTALFLLSESHLSLHTFPETGLATLNLYCCNPRPAWDWQAALSRTLGAQKVTVRELVRGGE